MSQRTFATRPNASSKAARSGVVMSAVPKAGSDLDIQISGDISDLKVKENYLDDQTLRTPKEYMFARSDFSVAKAKLEEVLDSGVLFRYHEPNAEDIPVAKLE
jgi:hypothetical protein